MYPKPVRAITRRELTRSMARILDEVEEQRNLILIIRGGKPAAVLAPVPDQWFVPPPKEFLAEVPPWVDLPPEVTLTSVQEEILEGVADANGTWHPDDRPHDIRETIVGISTLESKGLVKRRQGRWDLTDQGRNVILWRARSAEEAVDAHHAEDAGDGDGGEQEG